MLELFKRKLIVRDLFKLYCCRQCYILIVVIYLPDAVFLTHCLTYTFFINFIASIIFDGIDREYRYPHVNAYLEENCQAGCTFQCFLCLFYNEIVMSMHAGFRRWSIPMKQPLRRTSGIPTHLSRLPPRRVQRLRMAGIKKTLIRKYCQPDQNKTCFNLQSFVKANV